MMKLKVLYRYRKWNLIILIILSACLWLNCTNKHDANGKNSLHENTITTIKPNITPDNRMGMDITTLIDTVKFVKLELSKESMIGNINKVIIFEDRIYVSDNMTYSILVFSLEGQYLYKISKIGKGPGEYIQLDFFDIDTNNRQIILTDLMGYGVLGITI